MRKRLVPSSRAASGTLAAVLLGATLFSTAPLAHAARNSKVPKESRRSETREIESLEAQWRTAVINGDSAVMDKLLAEDFLGISARGTLSDKQQYLHHLATRATKFSAFDMLDLKVRVQLQSAVAISQAHIQGILEGRPIEGTFRYTNVYARTAAGGWRMTNFEATRVSSATPSDMDQGTPIGNSPSHTARR